MRGTVGVFTGIFNIDWDAGEIFQHNFSCQTRMAAGSASGDDETFAPSKRFNNRLKYLCRRSAGNVLFDGFSERLWLLINLSQHSVGKDCRLGGDVLRFRHV